MRGIISIDVGGLRNQVAGVGVGGETIPICIGAKGRVGVEREHPWKGGMEGPGALPL